jgi:AdoMet-dependent heme synthase
MASSRKRVSVRRPGFDVDERPFIVIWEMTRACDLACVHCRAEAIPSRHPGELTTAQARALIDEVAAFGRPAPIFVLTGGDPMKRPDLMELVAYGSKRHVPMAFSPSATPLLTPQKIAELRAAGLVTLSLSLDGASPAVHDAFRRVDGVFDRTLAAWQATRACGLKVQINTTVARINVGDLPRIAHLVRDYGAMTWSVFFLVPTGRAMGLDQISADECEDVMHFLYDVGTIIRVKATEGHHFRRVVLERTILGRRGIAAESVLPLGPTYRRLRAALDPWQVGPEGRRTPLVINAGSGFVFISHTGVVHPSGFLPSAAGNLRAQPLREIYRQSSLFRNLRDPARLLGRCGECEFAAVCGGSRSRAYGVTGNPLAEDPLCNYVPGSFPFQEDLAGLLSENAETAESLAAG